MISIDLNYDMKKIALLLFIVSMSLVSSAQPEDPKALYETARTFMRSGDFDNAIVVLNRALLQDKDNLDMLKDLTMSYYYKRDYARALETVDKLVDRDDADVVTYQIAGNVYKALEKVKDCDKMYRKALKKFPKSGPLYSEYGELLWSSRNFSAIDQWEKGIQVDPGFSGNYYNAAMHYFFTNDKVWSLIYGEIFINMESLSERGSSMKELLLKGYKEKLFADADMTKAKDKAKGDFAKAFLAGMEKQSPLVSKGISIETLTMIRTRFILDWYSATGARFPFKLFEYQRQLLQEGTFEAYNQWLFGPAENLAAYDSWTKTHPDQYDALNKMQHNRIFKMPAGQYYQVN